MALLANQLSTCLSLRPRSLASLAACLFFSALLIVLMSMNSTSSLAIWSSEKRDLALDFISAGEGWEAGGRGRAAGRGAGGAAGAGEAAGAIEAAGAGEAAGGACLTGSCLDAGRPLLGAGGVLVEFLEGESRSTDMISATELMVSCPLAGWGSTGLWLDRWRGARLINTGHLVPTTSHKEVITKQEAPGMDNYGHNVCFHFSWSCI